MSLHVTVVRARGLQRADCLLAGEDEANPFLTLRLLPGGGAKRHTQARKHTTSPDWNQMFVFDIRPEHTALRIKVWDANPLLHKEYLGEAIVDLPPLEQPSDASEPTLGASASASAVSASMPAAGWEPVSPSWVNVEAAGQPGGAAESQARDASDAVKAREEAAPVARWVKLSAGAKHAGEVARRQQRHGRSADDLGEVLLILKRLPASAVAGERHSTSHEEAQMAESEDGATASLATEYLHVDVASARNLLAADVDKNYRGQTSSDPYAVVRLWPPLPGEGPLLRAPFIGSLPKQLPLPGGGGLPALVPRSLPLPLPGILHLRRGGGGQAHAHADEDGDPQSGHERRTRVIHDSLDPDWDASFAFGPRAGVSHVQVTVFDQDAFANSDDYLGEALVPVPHRVVEARPGDAPGETPQASSVVQGWFPLDCAPDEQEGVRKLLKRLGRASELPAPPALGDLFVRLSYGPERDLLGANPAWRPSLRVRLGTLRVRVVAGADLPDLPGADVYAVHVLFEQKRAATRAVASHSPVWGSDAVFEFPITELAGDLVLRLVNRGGAVGEVCLPLHSLLPFCAEPLPELLPRSTVGQAAWYDVLKPRRPGEAVQRVRTRPKPPLGRLCAAVQLTLAKPLPFCYSAPEALPPTRAPGRPEEETPSFAHVVLAASRLADALLSLAAAPLRTVLYLQSWQAPTLNCSLALALALCTTQTLWGVTLALWPLLALLSLALNGYVSHLIHARDPVYLWHNERASDVTASRLAAQKERLQRMHAEAEAEAARSRGEAQRDSNSKKSYLKMYRNVQVQAEYAQGLANAMADRVERASNALTWHDPHATYVALLVLTILGVLGSVLRVAAHAAAACSPVQGRHLAALLGAFCLAPYPYATRKLLDGWDAGLLRYMPVAVNALTHGSGLEATRLEAADSPEQLRARVALEAATAAEARRRAREAAFDAKARLPQPGWRLNLGAVLSKLVSRAPNNARVEHLRIAARAAAGGQR